MKMDWVKVFSKNINKKACVVFRSKKHNKSFQAVGIIHSFAYGRIQLKPYKTNYPDMNGLEGLGTNLDRIESVVIM